MRCGSVVDQQCVLGRHVAVRRGSVLDYITVLMVVTRDVQKIEIQFGFGF